jgi:hypothetical protein
MAKAIPKKKSRSAQIEQVFSPQAQKKAERQISHYVMELDEKADEREAYTRTILKANDDSIERVVGLMVKELQTMEGAPVITFQGRRYNSIGGETEQLKRIQQKNFRYIAVRVLVACAKFDIRVGTFKLPKDFCADCGVEI